MPGTRTNAWLNIFRVPPEARWSHLQASAKQPTIGRLIDAAMIALKKVNPSLEGVLPKDYGRPALNAVMLGIAPGEGKDKARDLPGRERCACIRNTSR